MQRMNVMKLLTLNTHSLQESDGQQKLNWLVEGILREKPDILALQEVRQTDQETLIAPDMLEGQYPVPGCMPSVKTILRRRSHGGCGRQGWHVTGPGFRYGGKKQAMKRAWLC